MTVHQFPDIDEVSGETSRVAAAIDAARKRLLSLQHEDGHWCGELEGDTILESEYLLLLYYLGRTDEERFRKGAAYLRQQQLDHGGWPIYAGGPTELSASERPAAAVKRSRRERFWRRFFNVTDAVAKIVEAIPVKPLRRRALKKASAWIEEHLEGSGGLGAIFPPIVNTIFAFRALGHP